MDFLGAQSFRGDAKHQTRNLEILGLVLTHHPGMTESLYDLRKYRFARRSASAAAASGVAASVATDAHIWTRT